MREYFLVFLPIYYSSPTSNIKSESFSLITIVNSSIFTILRSAKLIKTLELHKEWVGKLTRFVVELRIDLLEMF